MTRNKETLSELLKPYSILEMEDTELLLSISKEITVDAGEILVREGEFNTYVYIVLKGLLRSYVTTSSGEERTVLISKEKMRAASVSSILRGESSEISVEALEQSHILVIDSTKFNKLIKSEMKLALFMIEGMLYFLDDAMERLHFFTVLSPEERFIKLREKFPDLIQRVPQKHLASYLGITTVSLSRIKSRVANNKK